MPSAGPYPLLGIPHKVQVGHPRLHHQHVCTLTHVPVLQGECTQSLQLTTDGCFHRISDPVITFPGVRDTEGAPRRPQEPTARPGTSSLVPTLQATVGNGMPSSLYIFFKLCGELMVVEVLTCAGQGSLAILDG